MEGGAWVLLERRMAEAAEVIAAQDRFIAAWGQMGTTWGISRTMAEVHALLFITGGPMCTDEVMERLEISRGNASMSLRALVDWGIVHREHKRGDRKEYFAAEQDVWTILQSIVRERMKREMHPVMAALAEQRDQASRTGGEPAGAGSGPGLDAHRRRVDEMLSLLRTLDEFSDKFLALPPTQLRETAEVLSKAMQP
jgi:DNA-binding transcriptional regulator GbsR (MarR family)